MSSSRLQEAGRNDDALRRLGTRSSSRAPGSSASAAARFVRLLITPICVFVAPSARANGLVKLVTKDSEMFETRPSAQKSRRPRRLPGRASISGSYGPARNSSKRVFSAVAARFGVSVSGMMGKQQKIRRPRGRRTAV